MIEIEIPGRSTIQAEALVLDYNGTLAIDGVMIQGVRKRLISLASKIRIFIITADTFGKAKENLKGIDCQLTILESDNQQRQKAEFIKNLGIEGVIAIGNGLNDSLMLKNATLGIGMIQIEGASLQTLLSAEIISNNILDALDLLISPLRITATLRN
jgi:P-type E1-E2 ATPase